MTDQEKLDKLEKRVKQMEDIILNLTCEGPEGLHVYKKVDKYAVRVPLKEYIHYYCSDFKEEENG